jgi:hypothetical protein
MLRERSQSVELRAIGLENSKFVLASAAVLRSSNENPLDLIKCKLVATAVIELRGAG